MKLLSFAMPLMAGALFLPAACMFSQESAGTASSVPLAAQGPLGSHIPVAPSHSQTLQPIEPIPDLYQMGSPYIPVDSWIYPAVLRLFSLGYADSAFIGLRPWTRESTRNILRETADKLDDGENNEEAREIYAAVRRELMRDPEATDNTVGWAQLESVYTRIQGVSGTPLNDSFHAGQTFINDYGRPNREGLNNVTGFSAATEAAGRFSLYVRGEYQHAPSAAGYSSQVSEALSAIDQVPFGPAQATLPTGPIADANVFRIVEANLSASILHNEVSFGKSDAWMGPAQGGSMAYSNNAENIYAFRINRTEPVYVPGLSRITGPFRYDFLIGSLKGHTYPNDPWMHAEKISFKPTRNLEFGFERTVIWGGKGHVPITLHSFFKSFFSFQNVSVAEKNSRNDPGARFGSFDFSYRLPYLRDWVTLYTDSEVHDDVSPISAPRRSGVRPGIYLAKFPRLHQLDLRVEGVSTDPVSQSTTGGKFLYWENVQRHGYTNKGMMFGDWIGRESKGGQAWLTYHLSPNESIQLSYRRVKAPKDFVPLGTTQNNVSLAMVKRIKPDVEVHASVQYEQWKAPFLSTGTQNNFATTAQVIWYPRHTVRF
ncbi:MAG TPA: capsule assembly Wzi family protein [Acidisarcina sp.]|nr:capsule assembly Wzi family protein [Acidisarcina sp.]